MAKLTTRSWSRQLLRSQADTAGFALPPGFERFQAAVLGDSHMVGQESNTATVIGTALRLPCVNLGVNGERTDQIAGRLATLTSSNVRLAIINGGINDLGQGYSQAHILTSWRTMLEYCATHSSFVVAVQMFPATAAAYSNALHASRVACNTALAQLVAAYSNAVTINCDAILGQFRAGGPVGNLYDCRTEYNLDDYHLNADGNQAFGAAVAALRLPFPLAQIGRAHV